MLPSTRAMAFGLSCALAVIVGCLAATPRSRTHAEDEGPPKVGYDAVKNLEDLAARDVDEKPRHTDETQTAVVDNTKVMSMCRRGRCPNGFRCGSAPGRPKRVCYAASQHRSGPRDTFEVTPPMR